MSVSLHRQTPLPLGPHPNSATPRRPCGRRGESGCRESIGSTSEVCASDRTACDREGRVPDFLDVRGELRVVGRIRDCKADTHASFTTSRGSSLAFAACPLDFSRRALSLRGFPGPGAACGFPPTRPSFLPIAFEGSVRSERFIRSRVTHRQRSWGLLHRGRLNFLSCGFPKIAPPPSLLLASSPAPPPEGCSASTRHRQVSGSVRLCRFSRL